MATRKIDDADIQQFEDLTHQSVVDVFQNMVSIEFDDMDPEPLAADVQGQIIGGVGFDGEVSGIICLHAGLGFAGSLAGKMLGMDAGEVVGEDMVNDVIGELSNMVAGSVKSRMCDRGWSCALTIPSIVRGQMLSVERPAEIIRKLIGFQDSRNQAHQLTAELLLKRN